MSGPASAAPTFTHRVLGARKIAGGVGYRSGFPRHRRFPPLPIRAEFRMKVTVERAELLRALSHVHRVVERRNTIPILNNVLVRAETAKLAFKATDLDLEVVETIAAEGAPGGVTTGAAHLFYE